MHTYIAEPPRHVFRMHNSLCFGPRRERKTTWLATKKSPKSSFVFFRAMSASAQDIAIGDLPWPGSVSELKSTKFQVRWLLTLAGLLVKEGAQACGCDPSLLVGKSPKKSKGCNLPFPTVCA